jgi:hypothetical protein
MTCSVATIPHLLLVVVAVVVVLETTKLQVLPDCAGLVAVWYAQDMLALLTMQRGVSNQRPTRTRSRMSQPEHQADIHPLHTTTHRTTMSDDDSYPRLLD